MRCPSRLEYTKSSALTDANKELAACRRPACRAKSALIEPPLRSTATGAYLGAPPRFTFQIILGSGVGGDGEGGLDSGRADRSTIRTGRTK